MGFILILLIILFLGGAGAFFLKSYDEKYVALQKNNMLLKSQIAKLQEKCSLLNSKPAEERCNIEFLTTDNQYGLLPKNSRIRVSPINSSAILNEIDIDMKVEITEKAIAHNSIWYYVILPIESRFNSRGWVEESQFSDIYSCAIDDSEN